MAPDEQHAANGSLMPMVKFSAEQQEVWDRVAELWALSKGRDERRIRSMLHPDYVGWDLNTPLPHDRDAAVRAVTGTSVELGEYELRPLSVHVYEQRVGIVHYSYSAIVTAEGTPPARITGKWSEVYLKQHGGWMMISVSGRPDAPHRDDTAAST
jgi:hypothetical protein